jgi:signal transduction histidine kinase
MALFRLSSLGAVNRIHTALAATQQLVERLALARLLSDLRERETSRQTNLVSLTHDLNNLLTVVSGDTQLLRRKFPSSEEPGVREARERIERLDENTRRLGRLLGTLSGTAQPVGRPWTPHLGGGQLTDIVGLAREGVKNHQPEGDPQISVYASDSSLIGSWDPVALERVLDNLLGNAIKYSPPGSPVSVSIVLDAPGSTTPAAILKISDQGFGIPPGDLPHIFEFFYRAENVRDTTPGDGVGLAMVRRFIDEAGGTVRVTSTPGTGSTFTLRLPLPVVDPTGLRKSA